MQNNERFRGEIDSNIECHQNTRLASYSVFLRSARLFQTGYRKNLKSRKFAVKTKERKARPVRVLEYREIRNKFDVKF